MTEDELTTTFARILKANDTERDARRELAEHETRLKPVISAAQTEQEMGFIAIQAYMAETGEYELSLPYDAQHSYRVYFATPRESVVGDADAAPDEFVTRSLKKTEVAKHLKALRDANQPEPNWARLEKGEKKLTYRLVESK